MEFTELIFPLLHSLGLLQAIEAECDAPCGLCPEPKAAQALSLQGWHRLEQPHSEKKHVPPEHKLLWAQSSLPCKVGKMSTSFQAVLRAGSVHSQAVSAVLGQGINNCIRACSHTKLPLTPSCSLRQKPPLQLSEEPEVSTCLTPISFLFQEAAPGIIQPKFLIETQEKSTAGTKC